MKFNKLSSFIITIFFLFNSGGYFVYFKLRQWYIQEEIEEELIKKMDESQLSLIIISLNDRSTIHWTRKNKEFSYNGMMYDIVKSKTVNQQRYLYCISDVKEKQLIDNFIKTNNRHNKKKLQNRINFNYFFELFRFSLHSFFQNYQYKKINILFHSNYTSTPSPPPKDYQL